MLHDRKMSGLKTATRHRNGSIEVKRPCMTACNCPLLYGSKTWTLHKGKKSRLRAVEMRYLRSACRVTWRDKWSNERVRKQYGVADVTGQIEK